MTERSGINEFLTATTKKENNVKLKSVIFMASLIIQVKIAEHGTVNISSSKAGW